MFHTVSVIRYVFYQSVSQLRLITFQVLNCHMWLVARIMHAAAPGLLLRSG